MKTRIVRLGNSQGVRIPKPLIEQAGLSGEVEIIVRERTLIIRPVVTSPRAGWADAFKEMASHGDDAPTDPGSATPTAWDESEWEW